MGIEAWAAPINFITSHYMTFLITFSDANFFLHNIYVFFRHPDSVTISIKDTGMT